MLFVQIKAKEWYDRPKGLSLETTLKQSLGVSIGIPGSPLNFGQAYLRRRYDLED